MAGASVVWRQGLRLPQRVLACVPHSGIEETNRRHFPMKSLMIAAMATMFATTALAEVKIGYVDLQRALNESDRGKTARDEFRGQVDKLQASLKRQKDDIESMKEQIEKKAAVMKDEERANLEEDYRKKLRDFERSYKDTQADLQRKDAELTNDILKDLQEIIRDYGDSEGYTVILETSGGGFLYGTKSADLTETILEQYNQKFPRKKK